MKAASLSLLVIGGCETKSTRLCPAFDGHPDLESWAPYEVGDMLTYVGDRGETQAYVLSGIERSEAFEETDFGDEGDVLCRAEGDYVFAASEGGHIIVQRYEVIDRAGVSPAESSLFVTLAARASMMEVQRFPSTYTFLLSDVDSLANTASSDRFESSVSSTREIGQITYRDVIERVLSESAVDRQGNPEITLTRVVFARDAGLVQFQRSDGQVFTRVPP